MYFIIWKMKKQEKNKKMLTKLIIVINFEYQNILKQNNKKEKVKQW